MQVASCTWAFYARQGPVATVIVKRGTLEEGQPLVLGAEWGRVRGLLNAAGHELQAALPGQPVEIFGLHAVPRAGDPFMIVQRCTSDVILSGIDYGSCELLVHPIIACWQIDKGVRVRAFALLSISALHQREVKSMVQIVGLLRSRSCMPQSRIDICLPQGRLVSGSCSEGRVRQASEACGTAVLHRSSRAPQG